MDALYKYYKDKHLDENKRLRLSYNILNAASKYRYFRPCIKQYLFSHVRSSFNIVDPKEWDMVLTLPIAQFRKASETKVWRDSVKKIRK